MPSFKRLLKNITRDCLRFILTPNIYNKFRFIIVHRYYPCFDEPRSFSEKIFSRKYDEQSLLLSRFVDKYTVREYVKQTIGERHLIPLISYTTCAKPDFFNRAPKCFVIKTSNGGGGENVKVVLDKSKLTDLKALSSQFNRYLKIKIGKKIDEKFYDIETPQLLMEELLLHKNGLLPSDYKFHIFKGSGINDDKVIIQVDTDRFSNHKRSLYSETLLKLDFAIQPKYDEIDNYVFPNNMGEMIDLAKKLASPFKYVRVDMYNVDGHIYFGELTFCHGSGWEPFSSKDADFLLGGYWDEYNSNHGEY